MKHILIGVNMVNDTIQQSVAIFMAMFLINFVTENQCGKNIYFVSSTQILNPLGELPPENTAEYSLLALTDTF